MSNLVTEACLDKDGDLCIRTQDGDYGVLNSSAKKAKKLHKQIPWADIKQDHDAGMPILEMAKKYGYYNETRLSKGYKDYTKDIRAILSRGRYPGYQTPAGRVRFDMAARKLAMKPKPVTVAKVKKLRQFAMTDYSYVKMAKR